MPETTAPEGEDISYTNKKNNYYNISIMHNYGKDINGINDIDSSDDDNDFNAYKDDNNNDKIVIIITMTIVMIIKIMEMMIMIIVTTKPNDH